MLLHKQLNRIVYFLLLSISIMYMLLCIGYSYYYLFYKEKDFYKDFHYPYDGEVRKFVKQLRNNQTPDVPPINGYNYKFINSCLLKCKEIKPTLVYIIKSAPKNYYQRLTIRRTWGLENRFNDIIRTIFVIGVTKDESQMNVLLEEINAFGDIVQVDFYDSYYNNTIKTMMGFKWAVKYCHDSMFYMFVDDDFYVSTKNVLRFIKNPMEYPYVSIELNKELLFNAKLYAGNVHNNDSPHRYKNKYLVTLQEYPYDAWPPFIPAGSYVLSNGALHEMYYTSFYTKHLKLDDIFLSIVAKKANITPFHSKYMYSDKKKYDLKGYANVISSHGYKDAETLLTVWNEQKEAGQA